MILFRRLALLSLVLAAACHTPYAEGRYACMTYRECPMAWYCRSDSLCWSTPGDDASMPDGALRDASIGSDGSMVVDAPSEPTTTVAVRSFWDDSPLMDIQVVFHDPSGGVADVQMTDAHGTARTHASSVGGATVDHGISLVSVLGLEPGDSVETYAGDQFLITIDRHLQLPGTFAGASAYTIVGRDPRGLSYVTDPTPVVIASDFAGATNLVALALDSSSQPLAYSQLTGVDPGGSLASFSAWQTDFRDVPFAVTGSGLAYVDVGSANLRSPQPAPTVTGMSGSVRILPTTLGEITLVARAQTSAAPVTRLSSRRSYRISTLPASLGFDFNACPTVTAISADPTDATRPVVSWLGNGHATAAMTTLSWAGRSWLLVAPPTSPIEYPALPSGAMPPHAADAVTVSLELFEQSGVDYATARLHPLDMAFVAPGSSTSLSTSY